MLYVANTDSSSHVSGKLELILLVLGGLNLNTGPHGNPSDELLADEVPDLNLPAVGLLVLVQVDVDGETEYLVSLKSERISPWHMSDMACPIFQLCLDLRMCFLAVEEVLDMTWQTKGTRAGIVCVE